ncbi:hypothetical protein AAHA92_33353 [Salvia divinorum]|uniref:F-box domain-containing protein n=1 Tax=Salvia divinorum TaxID=28513 RepID=A0ABD1FNQ2_SALDI
MASVQRKRLAYTDDRFSMLPDEILGLILSSLSLKDAMATSILCSRLRYSWIFTSNLDLHVDWYAALKKQPRDYDTEHTLQLWIDEWLNYAVSRKVESLDLNLIAYSPEKRYSFPYKQRHFPDNLKLLKKLCLHSVNVSGEAVAFMLGNCRLLEQLSLSETDELSSLEVVGTSSVFKCLAISQCKNLKSIVVRESEVVCIKYNGARCRLFVIVDVPLLTQLWIQADPQSCYFSGRRGAIKGILDMFRSVLAQLHT